MFDKFIEKIASENLNVHGIEIVRKQSVIFRRMFHEDIQYPIYSAAKSITSLAVGLLSQEGKLNIDAPLAQYLDAECLDVLSEKQRQIFCQIPIKRFLTMSVSGFPFRPEGDNWLEYALSSNSDYSKEPEFAYSNISAYLVGIVCENAAGMPLYDYLNEHIFKPLEINPKYQTDPQGRFYGATGMFMTVHELCLIGQLYLNRGKIGNLQLIPEAWIEESTKTHIKNSDGGYGYFIWTENNHYSISGKWGQKCLIYPQKEFMITYMSDMPQDSGKMLDLAKEFADKYSPCSNECAYAQADSVSFFLFRRLTISIGDACNISKGSEVNENFTINEKQADWYNGYKTEYQVKRSSVR